MSDTTESTKNCSGFYFPNDSTDSSDDCFKVGKCLWNIQLNSARWYYNGTNDWNACLIVTVRIWSLKRDVTDELLFLLYYYYYYWLFRYKAVIRDKLQYHIIACFTRVCDIYVRFIRRKTRVNLRRLIIVFY